MHAFQHKHVAWRPIEQWQETRSNAPDKSQQMLAYTRQDVRELNKPAREVRRENRELGADHVVETTRGEQRLAAGVAFILYGMKRRV